MLPILNGFKMPIFNPKYKHGFTLIEMAIVLIILGLVLSSLLVPIRAQRDLQAQRQTEETLARAKQVLLGYAQTFGRLPCPATPLTNGNEAPVGGGACTVTSGLLPAATLGIQPINNDGFAIDGWNNPIQYAVTSATNGGLITPDFTTAGEISDIGLATLQPNLRVCRSGTGVLDIVTTPPTHSCSVGITPETNFLTNNAVAVIFSLGLTGNLASGGVDELENATGNNIFVSHDIAAAGAPNGEFDHMVIWVSPFELYNGMIAVGQLR
jgi:prepilin-type N-terminal cleavage/methylation domain-containing protein